ncbi:MAG: hypothetical protein RID09_05655 [Coleofasciculus sp. G1-WW12-02]|uniref:hypothetical protein n=1 Tax=Coleofasciculus sp. G1-WW12-02 TaxID=3068483 RepID=UPI0032FADF17
MISSSSDHILTIWDLERREVIANFIGESELTCCAIAPDGITIVAGEASGRVHFLRLEGIIDEVLMCGRKPSSVST